MNMDPTELIAALAAVVKNPDVDLHTSAIAMAARTRILRLERALESVVAVADYARDEWDKAPPGMRAGKILVALAGGAPGYRSDIDAIHALRRPNLDGPVT